MILWPPSNFLRNPASPPPFPDRSAAAAPLYRQLADQLAAQVESGALGPGERLPSVRQFSAQQRVSVSTALQAYGRLEDHGLIEARPKSGYYVRSRRLDRLPEPQASAPAVRAARLGLGEQRARVLEAGVRPDVVPFGIGSPSMALLPVEKLHRTLGAVVRRAGRKALDYDPPPGCLALRRQLARRAPDWGGSLGPDDFFITGGAMEAIFLALRAVTRAGDTVALESPTYFGILQAVENLGLKALEIPTHPRDGLDLDALAAALARQRVAAVIAVPSFNNPLGSCMPERNRQRLVELLRKPEIPLIEDDIYGDLSHAPPPRLRAAKAFDRDGLVLLCGSVSKTLAPGWRVGWLAPGRFAAEVRRLIIGSTLATPTPLPLAVAEFLQNGGYDHHLRGLRATYARQLERTRQAVAECFPADIKLTRPGGGFLLWVELPAGVDANELAERALAAGVSIAAGPLFSAQARHFSNFIRLSCGHPWSPQLERGVGLLGHLVKQMLR